MSEFKEMKFRISSKEEDKRVQEYLFSLGYTWNSGKKYYSFYDDDFVYNEFLYTYTDGGIAYGDDEEYFKKDRASEYTLQEIVTYELKEVVKVHCKVCNKEITDDLNKHFKFKDGSYLCKECYLEVEKDVLENHLISKETETKTYKKIWL